MANLHLRFSHCWHSLWNARANLMGRCPCMSPHRPMPILDRIYLNPFEKWSRYGRFPWTFVFHLLLVVLVTSQATLLFGRDVQHVSRTVRHFSHLFADTSLARTGRVTLHSPQALQDAFHNAVRNHFFINNVSIVNFELVDTEALYVQVTWRDGSLATQKLDLTHYATAIRKNGTGGAAELSYLQEVVPFIYDVSLLPQLAVVSMGHSFRELGYVHGTGQECVYHWDLTTTFDGTEAGVFFCRVAAWPTDCQGAEWRRAHLLDLTCLSVSMVGLVLVLRKVWRSFRIASRLQSCAQAWGRLARRDIASLFSRWWILSLLMHVVQVASCIVCLQSRPDIGKRFEVVGFSCFLTWLNMTQYFESFPGYYMAFQTLGLSVGRVFRFLCSVGPLFCGFVLLGVCLFWRSRLFENPASAASVLFSLMNGDIVHETFDEVHEIGGFLAHVYIYVFIFLFIYVILNVNISIVTDAYEAAKLHPQRENALQIRLARQGSSSGNIAGSPTRAVGSDTHDFLARRASAPSLGRVEHAVEPATGSVESSNMEVPRSNSMERRPSLGPQGYVTPRYFDSGRIQDALALAFPEELVLGDHDSLIPPGPLRNSCCGAAADAVFREVSAEGAQRNALEMMTVKRSWEQFDRVLDGIRLGVEDLRKGPLRQGSEVCSSTLAERLDELGQAVERTIQARGGHDRIGSKEI